MRSSAFLAVIAVGLAIANAQAQQTPGKQKQTSRKDRVYRPIEEEFGSKTNTNTNTNANTNDLEDVPCMLRDKADCHGGVSADKSPSPAPSLQQQPLPYNSNAYSGQQVQQDVLSEEPSNYLPPRPSLSNQYSDYGQIGYSYNQQQPAYNQQQPSYNQQAYQSQSSGNGNGNGNGQQNNQVQNSQNHEEQPPNADAYAYPGCPAAMICVPDDWCNATGYSVGRPLGLTPVARLYRVAVMVSQ